MYEIRPESLKTFVEDNSIKLPRFQRKQTWNDKKNFELCISIFQEYPLGVCILNVEKSSNIDTKWLLDGRQRRNAIDMIWRDPEKIYLWGAKWIGIKNNDQVADIKEKFKDKIAAYLDDYNDEENDEENDSLIDIEDEDVIQEIISEDEGIDDNASGLDFLLELIILMHNRRRIYTGLTRPFDFSDSVNNLPYVLSDEQGKQKINARKWKSFIVEYESYCSNEGIDVAVKESFVKFMLYRFNIENESQLKNKIDANWQDIHDRINIIDKIRNLMTKARIGLIEIKDINPADAQKIFNIINSKGTKLSAVEVLSAKPSWNKSIRSNNTQLKDSVKNLYEKIQVNDSSPIVKWDIPATLISRLNYNDLFLKEFSNSTPDFNKKLNLGFKILSGIYEKGVTKEHIDLLSKDPKITWESDIDNFVFELNSLFDVISQHSYFRFLKSWKCSLLNMLSEAITVNFILIIYKDMLRTDQNLSNQSEKQRIQKNAIILLDRLIYEYVKGLWKGSSDSKIAKELNDLKVKPIRFNPINKQKWLDLLSDIFDNHSIDSVSVSQVKMTPILYHSYAMSCIRGDDSLDVSFDVDHIIPKALFVNANALGIPFHAQDNLFNLCLLPKKDNCSKGKKRLKEITNEWLKTEIERCTTIQQNEFNKFSDLNNFEALKEKRKPFFDKAFGEKRESILNN